MSTDIALFGGSFDPVHMGHLHILHEVSLLTGMKRVIVIPAHVSNFKQGARPASFSERCEMLRLAIEDYREIYTDDELDLVISEIEGERGGVSYTSDTVRELLPKYGKDGRIGFIIGDDIIPTLDRWHDFGYLKEHVDFHCFSRNGEVHETHGASVKFYESRVLEASSTSIRAGEKELLSPRVREYVEIRGLYRT